MLISPSILSVDKNKYNEVIKLLESLKVPMLHLDVMDGKFVPNTTYDAKEVEKIKKQTSLIIDTHLMIETPEKYINDYILTKSDYITFHIEASKDPSYIISEIKKAGLKAGISVKPNTPVEFIERYLDDIDLVLVMSVEPGFGGQKFISDILPKIEYLNIIRNKIAGKFIIEVDGGINPDTALLAKEAGSDYVVVGSYLMKGSEEEIITKYKGLTNI